MSDEKWPPANLVHMGLWEFDRTMLTSPDGKNVQVSLDAICKIIANPPPMLQAPRRPAPAPEGWRLVPVEPTKEMLMVVQDRAFWWPADRAGHYRAMVAAAPSPPQQKDN